LSGDPPRLVATAQSPIPQGVVLEVFAGADGAPLRAAFFPRAGAPRGSVVLSPGRTEPIEKYFEVIEELRGRGFAVLAHDWRGQGLSHRLLPDCRKGHCQDWRHYVADHKALIDAFEAVSWPSPWGMSRALMRRC
jgi:lysophospholipase